MAGTRNSYGITQFSDGFDLPGDLQDLADDLDVFANLRRGTASDRTTLVAGKIRDGMLFDETDTGNLWQYTTAKGWRCLTGAMLAVATGTAQTIANNTITDVVFTGQTATLAGTGLALNASTGVVTASIGGTFRVHGEAVWAAGGAAAASHALEISKNNATTGLGSALATVDVTNQLVGQHVAGVFTLAPNDTIRLKAFQVSGVSKDLFVSGLAYYTQLIIERIPG